MATEMKQTKSNGGLCFVRHVGGAVVMGWTGHPFQLFDDVQRAVQYLRDSADQLEQQASTPESK